MTFAIFDAVWLLLTILMSAGVYKFYGSMWSAITFIAMLQVMMTFLFYRLLWVFNILRISLYRWDVVVDRFENATSSPIERATSKEA